MTGLEAFEGRSGRRCHRVESIAIRPTEGRGLGGISAPESLTLGTGSSSLPGGRAGGVPAVPERRATPNVKRTTKHRLERIQRDLSVRDRSILMSVYQHRFLTTTQIQGIHFSDHATIGAASRVCRRVLARLFEGQLIEHLERRMGGVRAGSASYVWRLGLVGDRVISAARGDGSRARRKEPSARHLDHCLAIADRHIDLVKASRVGQLVELITVQTEPSCWRSYLGLGGQTQTLKPDLYVVTASGEFEDHWFVEVDRNTESIPTLIAKCAQYEHYRRAGGEQADSGIFPLVVWVVPDAIRQGKLQTAVAASRRLDLALYRICTPDQFVDVVWKGAA